LPCLLDFSPARFPNALEMIDALPWQDPSGRLIPAARAAMELALLDVYSRHFKRPISDAVGWMEFSKFGSPGSIGSVRCSGVLTSQSVENTMRVLRGLWWYGLRDFKLKVANESDEDRLAACVRYLDRPIRAGRATLRIDANGGWTLPVASDTLNRWQSHPIEFVEQPLAKGDEDSLGDLKACAHQRLMHDESLVTLEDARRLVDRQVVDGFNIRISKCGGLLPSLRLADYAFRHGVAVQLGCMVGETSILSAVGRRFLELVPNVRFVEGQFGTWLLQRDIVRKPLRFGYGGAIRPLSDTGWGIDVDLSRLPEDDVCSARFVL
jgi:L-Ala-D/L-Glu epimerase / N-acetyl-D-glutamate racemase